MNEKLLSIVTINLNDVNGLKKTFFSLEHQLNSSIEWIVIDGGSNDGSVEFLSKKQNFLHWWCSETDSGIYNAMNKGFLNANGQFILFLNSGDFLVSDILKEIVPILENNNCAILLAGGYVELGGRIRWYRKPRNLKSGAFHSIPALHQSTIYNRSLIPENGYDESYKVCGDHWLAAKFASCFSDSDSILVDMPFSIHPIHGGQAFSNPMIMFAESWRIQRDILNGKLIGRIKSFLKRLISYIKVWLLSSKFVIQSRFTKLLLGSRVKWIK